VTEIHLVQIHLENAVLGVAALELQRQHRLLQLALEALVRREEEDLGELLGDRAATLDDPSAPIVLDDGTRHADRIDTPVRVEAPVLRRQDRVAERLGDLGQWHQDAPLHMKLGDGLIVVVVNLRTLDGL